MFIILYIANVNICNVSDPSRISARQLIKNKELNFWEWLKKSNVRMDEKDDIASKLIPGAATAFAILIFLAQAIVTNLIEHYEIQQYLYRLVLNIINILIILFILYKRFGEKEHINVKNIDFVPFAKANIRLYTKLENQFIRCINGFFSATLVLYLALTAQNINSIVRNEALKRDPLTDLASVSTGDSLIRVGLKELDVYLADSSLPFKYAATLIPHVGKIEHYLKMSTKLKYVSDSGDRQASGDLIKLSGHLSVLANNIDSLSLFSYGHDSAVLHALICLQRGYYLLQNGCQAYLKRDYVDIGLNVLMLLASNISAVFIIAAFLVLYSKTLNERKNDKSYIYFVYALTDSAKASECPDDPPAQNDIATKSILRYAILTCLILTLASLAVIPISSYPMCYSVVEFLSGLFCGIAMCMLFGRFESAYFQPTLSVLLILYLYAIIQSFLGFFNIPFLDTDRSIEYFTKLVAFICKCIFYLYVLWIYRTDRLLFYFYQKENVHKDKMRWKVFLKKLYVHDKEK